MRFFSKPKHPSAKKQRDLDKRLFNAAIAGHTEEMRALLAAGADVHMGEDSALRYAAGLYGETESVKILLANGANVHAANDLALCLAARNGHSETVKALLAARANVHAQDDEALCLAAAAGQAETVQTLLASGASVHADDDYARHTAGANGHAAVVEILRAADPLLGVRMPEMERGPAALAKLLRDAEEEQAGMAERPSMRATQSRDYAPLPRL